jgi:hypothetical protein
MGFSRNHLRSGSTSVLAGLVIGGIFGLSACGAGDGEPSARPSADVSIDRPSRESGTGTSPPADATHTQPTRSREVERTTEPAEATTRPPTPAETTTRPPTPAETTTRPPTPAAVVPTQTTRTTAPAETTPPPTTQQPAATLAASESPAAVAVESEGVGRFGWLVLIGLLAAMIIGGLLLYRSQRKSAWDAEARALEAETRTVIDTRLGPVLTATTAGQRGLTWPPVRVSLVDLVNRWNGLTEQASGEPRRNWSLHISGLLQDLIAAVDAENEALAGGMDWTLLRPRVVQAQQALSAVLAGQPWPEPPPAAEEPGPPAFQT